MGAKSIDPQKAIIWSMGKKEVVVVVKSNRRFRIHTIYSMLDRSFINFK
jgi:hypothetical protein